MGGTGGGYHFKHRGSTQSGRPVMVIDTHHHFLVFKCRN
jgi:hypothetical protein